MRNIQLHSGTQEYAKKSHFTGLLETGYFCCDLSTGQKRRTNDYPFPLAAKPNDGFWFLREIRVCCSPCERYFTGMSPPYVCPLCHTPHINSFVCLFLCRSICMYVPPFLCPTVYVVHVYVPSMSMSLLCALCAHVL